MALAMAASARFFCPAGASASARAATRAWWPSCRIVVAKPASPVPAPRALAASSALSGALIACFAAWFMGRFMGWFMAWFMALIRLAFVAFVTCPAKSRDKSGDKSGEPSELVQPSRYAQQSTAFVRPLPNFRNPVGIWGVAAWNCHAERGAMPLSIRHKLGRLPKRLPVGTTFVVEGRTVPANGKNNEHLRVFSRFVVLPGGRLIDVGGDATGLTRGRRPRRCSRPSGSEEGRLG